MKISSLVLASSAHAAWEDKWNTVIAGKDEGYVDFQLRGNYSSLIETSETQSDSYRSYTHYSLEVLIR